MLISPSYKVTFSTLFISILSVCLEQAVKDRQRAVRHRIQRIFIEVFLMLITLFKIAWLEIVVK